MLNINGEKPVNKNLSGVTLRAILVGIILCVCIAVGEPYGVMVIQGSPMCADFSTGGAIFLFFILVFLINFILRLISPKISLSKQELIVVYIMMIVACAIPSWGFTMNLIYILAGSRYFATPESEWTSLIHPHIKDWIAPKDPEAIRMFFEGLPRGESIPWGAWLQPLISWICFILAVYLVMISIAVIFRKQWVDKERLLFPLTQLPLEMAEEKSTFFKNKIMWLGFAIPFVIYSINAFHNYYHFIPEISLGSSIPIMNRSTTLGIRIFFEVIGLAYLLSLDVSLSLWLFALLATIETGIFNLIGFSIGPMQAGSDPGPQTVANQGLGAMIVLVGSCIWVARAHLKDVFKKAFKGDKSIDDRDEALSYRTSVFCLILGLIFIIIWLNASGLSLFHTLIFVLFALIIFIGLSRIVCQAGLAYGRPPVFIPVATVHAIGATPFGASGMTALGFVWAWAADVRTMVLASTANGLKMANQVNLKGRKVFLAIILAIIVTLIASMWVVIYIGYQHGGLNLAGWQPRGIHRVVFNWVKSFIKNPIPIGGAQFGWMGIGGALMLGMTILRNRFLWWPVHPIGLALGLAGPFAWVWFSVFLAWLAKFIIVKLGGAKAYRFMRPFFLGLILGGFVAAGMWLIIDFFTGMTGNMFTQG